MDIDVVLLVVSSVLFVLCIVFFSFYKMEKCNSDYFEQLYIKEKEYNYSLMIKILKIKQKKRWKK